MVSGAETIGMEYPPDNHFWHGILAYYAAHILAAGGFIVHIGHGVKVIPNVPVRGEVYRSDVYALEIFFR